MVRTADPTKPGRLIGFHDTSPPGSRGRRVPGPSHPDALQTRRESSFPAGRSSLSCALRSDFHEEASVKTGARRWRDFPNIHSASSAMAERHETVCGRSHSIPRRRDAPRRTSRCDLSPALDLDLDSLLPVVPVRFGPSLGGDSRPDCDNGITCDEQIIGLNRGRLAWGAGGGNERPWSPARGRRNPVRMSLPRPADLLWHPWITSSLGLRGRAPRRRTAHRPPGRRSGRWPR
jgi:hypothetical protein